MDNQNIFNFDFDAQLDARIAEIAHLTPEEAAHYEQGSLTIIGVTSETINEVVEELAEELELTDSEAELLNSVLSEFERKQNERLTRIRDAVWERTGGPASPMAQILAQLTEQLEAIQAEEADLAGAHA